MKVTVHKDQYEPGRPVMQQDLYHMGTPIGKDLMILRKKHTGEEQPYLILVNEKTGESVRIQIDDQDYTNPTQMFVFSCRGVRNVVVQAVTAVTAQTKLERFVEERPLMPRISEWQLIKILGHLDPDLGIWSMDVPEQ